MGFWEGGVSDILNQDRYDRERGTVAELLSARYARLNGSGGEALPIEDTSLTGPGEKLTMHAGTYSDEQLAAFVAAQIPGGEVRTIINEHPDVPPAAGEMAAHQLIEPIAA